MKKVYLDNAATTQVRENVIAKMQDALANFYGNPSSTHSFGRSAKTAVESARKTIAKYMNAHPSEIIFTSGGTEADNMILRCAVRDLKVETIITSKIEHHAVLHTVEDLASEKGIKVLYVDLDVFGNPDLLHLESLLKQDDSKKLVSLMHVNNEIGNKIDIAAVCELCHSHGALFHSDTVQSIGHYLWDVKAVPVDFLTAAAHKFHGPKGIGFAYIKKNSGLKPMIAGGAQERGYRAGTESFHNIVGLEMAFVEAYDNLEAETAYVTELKSYFIDRMKEEIPNVKFNGHSGDLEKSTFTLVNACLPIDSQKALMLLFHLDMKGIACSKGSACQSGSDLGSHVLAEILSEDDFRKPSLRFSFSKYNTKEELDYTVQVLKEFVEK
ncbi:cysteine desulfurase family protein [Zobellia galactanivorans]|uniref:cysteine desulfurase family protein n=1 Tax=Zobellia galactanivorans (strain DSM 12802 / CCUG 47099 / CIP 106680 / NCIMB 13871 / Dsij) TaxID=63186 RepID=UPI001C076B00|nr:cysteine desulfurase family protein [Zobellia galactanivorans]MBU3025311.1 cysteine desulfurase [Zobellia galactanivorans]MDO6810718.1 cysteine desulfurase family protein [Zobellia galactanivorans]